jgi:hypothetical protein
MLPWHARVRGQPAVAAPLNPPAAPCVALRARLPCCQWAAPRQAGRQAGAHHACCLLAWPPCLPAERTPYSLPLVLRWCRDIAAGLAYLHPAIVHRDLKPSNVLLAPPTPGTSGGGGEAGEAAGGGGHEGENRIAKISDFGLAR